MRFRFGDPLLAFFILGAGLFLVYGFIEDRATDPITLSDPGLTLLLDEYRSVTGRAADADARQDIIDDYYRREVLYREGLRREVYRSDGALREAIIERMQQQVSGILEDPDGRDLVNFYTDHIDRYYREATISFEQRFFREAPAEPELILDDLQAGRAVNSDPPPAGERFPAYGESMIRGLFGDPVLSALRGADVNHWTGPVASANGWHFFRVSARQARALLPFAQAKDQVLADYQSQALDRRLDDFIASQAARYPLQRSP